MTKRDDYLGLRLSAAEKQAVHEWAGKEKRSASDMARLLIGEALEARSIGRQPAREPKRGGSSGSTDAEQVPRTDLIPHEFKASKANSMKCETCGKGMRDH